jgi:hypothetical protein
LFGGHNKTDYHDIPEILLKVALNTINLKLHFIVNSYRFYHYLKSHLANNDVFTITTKYYYYYKITNEELVNSQFKMRSTQLVPTPLVTII